MGNNPTIQPHTILYRGRLYSCTLVTHDTLFMDYPHIKADDGKYYCHFIPLAPDKVPVFCRNINWDPNIPLPIVHALEDNP